MCFHLIKYDHGVCCHMGQSLGLIYCAAAYGDYEHACSAAAATAEAGS